MACTCWVPDNHIAPCALVTERQVANYKTTLGAWLFLGIAAVLLHAEWGKWACQPSPKLLWWVQMRQGAGSLLGTFMRGGGAGGCVNTHKDTHRTHRLMALICKLSGKVGQNVTNKRDFQILMAARSVIDQQVHSTLGLSSDTQIPTERLRWDCHIPTECLHCACA